MDDLRKLAEAADEGYAGAHPRDSNNWRANEAFCLAATPERILRLLDVAEKAEKAATWLERLAARAEEQSKAWQGRLPASAEACAADAKNYRATAADIRTALEALKEDK